uniref:Rhodanese domain-containing protein n=1 Tax=Kalanchoe fedtschenkoi TaxID=63787 RepID=A0A7N0TPI1_KALFE
MLLLFHHTANSIVRNTRKNDQTNIRRLPLIIHLSSSNSSSHVFNDVIFSPFLFVPSHCPSSLPTIPNRYSQCLALGRELESSGVPTSVPVKVAHELLQAGHRYLDVRTPEEFGAGHASGAINIPYMYRTGSGMVKNPKFLEEVALEFRKYDEIIVGCQSGKRSMMAAADLLDAGFTSVTYIAGGYAAWAQTGLPIEE